MEHYCDGVAKFYIDANKKKDTNVELKLDPEGDGHLLVVSLWIDKQPYGWGMRWYYCPLCGEKLDSGK